MPPVEFARESSGRKITLLICKDAVLVSTLWALVDIADVITARQQLGVREFEDATSKWIEANIGFWSRSSGEQYGDGAEVIAAWAGPRDLAGAV
jgi:hypothetical protein